MSIPFASTVARGLSGLVYAAIKHGRTIDDCVAYESTTSKQAIAKTTSLDEAPTGCTKRNPNIGARSTGGKPHGDGSSHGLSIAPTVAHALTCLRENQNVGLPMN